MGKVRDRAWRRWQRRRIIRKRLRQALEITWWRLEDLGVRQIGQWARQSPFFCGCTKSHGWCKRFKRLERKARRRARKAIPPESEW